MSNYDDVLRCADGQLGCDWNADPTREEAFKLWNVSFSAAPKQNVTVGHTWTRESEWKESAYVEKEKTATKFGLKAHDVKWGTTFANDKFAVSAAGQLLKENDWTVNASGAYETKPAKKEWKATGSATVTSPDFSGVKAHINLDSEHNEKSEWKVNAKLNLNIQKDHNVGVSTEHDTKTFKKIFAQATTRDGDNVYWARANVLTHSFHAGCMQTYKNFAHSYDVEYNATKDFKGFQGQPVVVTAGGRYTLSDQTSFTYNGTAGEHLAANAAFKHKVDSHWTVGAHQHFDGARLSGKRNPYDLGFEVEYKL